MRIGMAQNLIEPSISEDNTDTCKFDFVWKGKGRAKQADFYSNSHSSGISYQIQIKHYSFHSLRYVSILLVMMFLPIPLYCLPSFLYTFLFHFHAFIFDESSPLSHALTCCTPVRSISCPHRLPLAARYNIINRKNKKTQFYL